MAKKEGQEEGRREKQEEEGPGVSDLELQGHGSSAEVLA